MKTFADYLYKEMKLRGEISRLQFNNSKENTLELNEIMIDMNITKSQLFQIEIEYPGTVLHLSYLLQKHEEIPFDICENYKVWKNKEGWQYGCRFDKGLQKRIQVHCKGRVSFCERKKCLKQQHYENLVQILTNYGANNV